MNSTASRPDFFTHIQQWLDSCRPNECVRLDLNEWERAGIWIAGFPKESPGQNLEAWLQFKGHRSQRDEQRGVLEIITSPGTALTPQEYAARRDGRTELDHWPDNFAAGDRVTLLAGPHAGESGVVVRWNICWGGRRPGMVAVFLPKYDNTYFWWVPPAGLRRP